MLSVPCASHFACKRKGPRNPCGSTHSLAYHRRAHSAKAFKPPCATGKAEAAALAGQASCISTRRRLLHLPSIYSCFQKKESSQPLWIYAFLGRIATTRTAITNISINGAHVESKYWACTMFANGSIEGAWDVVAWYHQHSTLIEATKELHYQSFWSLKSCVYVSTFIYPSMARKLQHSWVIQCISLEGHGATCTRCASAHVRHGTSL